MKVAQRGYPAFELCNGDTAFVLISGTLPCLDDIMAYYTILELMQTLLVHAEPAQHSFLSRRGPCLILMLTLLTDIPDAFILLVSDLVTLPERKLKKALKLFKLQSE